MYLLKFEEDYADEFNVYGMKLVNETELQELVDYVNELADDFATEWYFGSNECIFLTKNMLGRLLESCSHVPNAYILKYTIFEHSNTYGNFPEILELDQ